MGDADVEMRVYRALRSTAVGWRVALNRILNAEIFVDDAVFYATATRHYEAFEEALDARRRAYARPAC